jgi:hypothetical protein
MKKHTEFFLVVSTVALCLLVILGLRVGVVSSQTTTPASSAPASSAPAAPAAGASSSTVANRPLAEWQTTNMVFLTTLIRDANQMLSYLKGENLAYAEIACPQLLCDIRTMQGRSPATGWLRYLQPAPSRYRCPPIPDAQAAADLNAGMAQLEAAVNHIITGENSFNGDMIRLGEAETQAACDTFAKVLTDLQNAPSNPSTIAPGMSTPIDTINSFLDAVQAGDVDVVAIVTGGAAGEMGVEMWSAKDLQSFVGHTTFTRPMRNVLTHNDNLNANVNVDGFMTFTDPGGFPAVENTCHFYIDGDFKLKAVNGNWIIVSLPGYQEALCDGPTSWDGEPMVFPSPGDAI